MKENNSRPDLVAEVARTFRANGFHGTTMSVISKRTGLGRSSIYHHFGRGKLEMAQRSLDLIETFIDVMAVTISAPDISLQAKWGTIEGMLRHHYEGGQLGCLLAVFAMEDVPVELRNRTKALFDLWINATARLYESGGVESADSHTLAQKDVAALQGALILSRAQSCATPFERTLAEITTRFGKLSAGIQGR
nr:TetR/AcrR family transcriptional regulator [uncultured Halomonas sp.]